MLPLRGFVGEGKHGCQAVSPAGGGVDLDPTQAFDIIARFESHLWTGWRAGAKLYIQDYELPTILSMAADGTYERAMSNEQTMVDFTEQLAKRLAYPVITHTHYM